MTTTDRKDVELRIRARFEGQKTLTQLTDQIDQLTKAQEKQLADAEKGTAKAKELDITYQKLERSLRAVAAAYGESTRYEKLTSSIATLQQRIDTAKAKQDAFTNSLAKGAELTDRQAQKQYLLGAAVDRATKAMERAQAQVSASAGRLREYGVDTSKISEAQTRMRETILRGNVALKAQEDAVDKAVTSQKRLGHGEVSAALDRIKAQVMGLAAAYVGVHQSAALAGDTIKAYSSREGVKNQLAISVGNNNGAIDAEYAYVKAQADRIGIEFDQAAKGYAKFAAAASMAGRTRQEIRYIWEAFAEVGRVANLSTDELNGVFKALEQITSKGKIQAEELRGQLGDRLFGAFQVAAKALKDTFPDLDKALKDGAVSSEQLVAIAEEYRRTVGGQLPAAMKSLSAEQARMNNAVTEFKLAIADAGFADAFRAALVEITAALKSENGAKFADGLAMKFSAVADAVVWLLKNLDQVLIVLKALAGLYALNVAGNAAKGLADYTAGLKALSADAKLTVKGLGLLRGAFAVLQAALIGWSLGAWASEEFEVVRKAGVSLVTGIDEMWTRIKFGAQLLWEEVPRYARNAIAAMLNGLTWGTRQMLIVLKKGLEAIGRGDLAATIGRRVDELTAKYEEQGGRVAEIRAEMQREIERIRELGMELWTDAERKPKAIPGKAVVPTQRPDSGPVRSIGPTEAEIAKRQRLIDEITRNLEALDAKLDRAQTGNLRAQLAAIDSQYAALSRKIATVGGATGKELAARLDVSLNQLRDQTSAKFNAAMVADRTALTAKLDAVDAAAGRKSKTDLDARLAAIRTQYESTYREIEAFKLKLQTNDMPTAEADTAKARLDAGILELQQLETQRFYKDELRRLEGGINDLLSTRSDRLKTIADQESASLITAAQARAQTEGAVDAIQPRIETLVDTARVFAESLRGAFDPVIVDAFIAKLDLAKGSGKRLNETFELTGRQVDDMINKRSVQAFEGVADAIGAAIKGQRTFSDAIRESGVVFLKFAADFIREIGLMILRTTLLKAIQGSGIGGPIAAAVNTMIKHEGGLVAAGGGPSRQVSPFMFIGAPRYHAGGIAGLAPNEYPAILKKNEEVLTEGDPRHILNAGRDTGSRAAGPQSLKIFNMIDSASVVSEGLATQQGEKAIFNFIRANRTGLKQILS